MSTPDRNRIVPPSPRVATRSSASSTIGLFGLAAAATLLVACGGDDEGSGSEESALSPAEAVAEVEVVHQDVGESLRTLRDGDADAAEELVSNAYLEHFELVEGPLEDIDAELNEELEELLREEMRAALADGESASAYAKLVAEAERGLEQARRKLESASG